MKIEADYKLNLKTKEVQDKVKKDVQLGLKDVMVDIANDVIKGSPHKTGHNRRSIAYKLGSVKVALGTPQGDEPDFINWEPELKESEAAIFSTSGYGGYLETGTRKMGARPYFKPALDRNIKNLPKNIKAHLE